MSRKENLLVSSSAMGLKNLFFDSVYNILVAYTDDEVSIWNYLAYEPILYQTFNNYEFTIPLVNA